MYVCNEQKFRLSRLLKRTYYFSEEEKSILWIVEFSGIRPSSPMKQPVLPYPLYKI